MKLQAPKGTRDFYPREMAWRNFLMDAWRRVSVRNGFEQVDGPIYETLDLYKVKSGGEMVGQAFRVRHPETEAEEYAVRPEFTPTLARMVAERANTLPKPIKWFSLPNVCRAERPQRGRLREHWQWNIDIIGLDQPVADAEAVFTAVDLFAELGLTPDQIRVKISHRETVRHILSKLGVADEQMLDAFNLLDRRDKIEQAEFVKAVEALGLDSDTVARFDQICRMKYRAGDLDPLRRQIGMDENLSDLFTLDEQLCAFNIAEWCEYDLGIVRGLAYYTGTVFEIYEATGAERAVAGGGRYDNLIELFDGPKMPAVGFGMGDVVLSLVLSDKGLMPDDVTPRPDAYIVAATEQGAGEVARLTSRLRQAGLHARFSYRTTRSLGKLLKEADAARARFAVILDDTVAQQRAELKDFASGEQTQVAIGELAGLIAGGG